MTDLSQTSSGTVPVPGAANSQGSDGTVAALQLIGAAMTTLAQQHSSSAGTSPGAVPAAVAATTVNLPQAPVGLQNHGPWLAGGLYTVVPSGPLLPATTPGDDGVWYCITRGHFVGITPNNALALNAVTGVTANAMKSYKTQALALAAFNGLQSYGMVSVAP
ncbi:hypothetical protein C8R43DRAFT_1135852 [Mycena crocata]|nr:hypothetical protein C8R43DRAFT_1135852 [Mycena crocata]